MKNLVKSMLFALSMLCSTMAFAQQGSSGVGVNFGYQVGGRGVSNVGLGIKYNYMITDHLRAEVNGMYYFKGPKASLQDLVDKKYYKTIDNKPEYISGKDTEWFDVNINAHYLFDLSDKCHLYPVFGFAAMFGRTHFDYAEKVGLNTNNLPDFLKPSDETKEKTSYSDAHFRPGANLGAGFQYDVTEDFAITFEAKYKLIKHFGNFNMALGCVVLF